MGKTTGFLEYTREEAPKRPVTERVLDFREFEGRLPVEDLEKQAGRCMDCGIPYCHTSGCPVRNLIPEWNDMVYRQQWRRALELLHSTDNFPEFTGRVCPAPCEPACTLAINQPAVTIRQIELHIIERGWREGWVRPEPAKTKTRNRVAVIGSGPAGLAVAQQLARRGHDVVVFEKSDRLGGLLRYGIPDFKMEKWVIDRRLEQLVAEGVFFEPGVNAGVDVTARYLQRSFDAIVLTTGAEVPRDVKVPGRELDGVHFAMDFLTQQNKRVAGDRIGPEDTISAKDRKVVVIGGGDTGSDCIGTSHRQGARRVVQIEILPRPPEDRTADNPWPTWPWTLKTSSSHEEGCERLWSIGTKEFIGADGRVEKMKCVELDWSEPDESGRRKFEERPGSEFEMDADLVLLAAGFVHPEHGPLVTELGLATNSRGNIEVDSNYMTNVPGIFAAGDSMTGATLVVTALHHGRDAADPVHEFLMSGGSVEPA